ncbi:MAG: TonB-dependent receptor [Pseudomonadota bacterium]
MKTANVLLCLATGLGAASAQAQSNEAESLGTLILGIPDNNSVEIDAGDFTRTTPTDLQDVFKSEPTITVGSSLPVSQKLYVNGVEETNLSVTIDGARQNNKIFHHNATTLIDPELLKQVRIDPSVAPADAGPGALAGAVAYETKDVDDLLAPGLSFGGLASGEYDSNGNTFTASTAFFTRQGNFEALAFVKSANGGIREDGSGTDIVGSGAGLVSGLAKVAYKTQAGGRFELSYERVNDEAARPYRADIGRVVVGRPVPDTRVYDLNRQNVVFTYSTTAPQGMWDPTITLAYSATDLALPEATQIATGTTKSVNGSIENRFALANGSITAGLDFYSESGNVDYRNYPTPAFNEAAQEKSRNIGLYAQARLDLSDRARLSFGGRADYQRFQGVDGSKFSDSGLSANVSGEFDVSNAVTFSAGASHVWGGVALAENFIMSPRWVYPAGGIEAVTADNMYIAANVALGAWDFKAKAFKTDIENARAPNYRRGPALTSDAVVEGFELGAKYSWQNGFFRVGYARMDADVNGTTADSFFGRYLTTPIGEVVSLELAHAIPSKGLIFGADAELALTSTATVGDPLPSYQVVNAFVEYQPRSMKNLTIRAEVNNLFDENYSARGTYGQEYVSSGVQPLREPGRSISIRGTLNF